MWEVLDSPSSLGREPGTIEESERSGVLGVSRSRRGGPGVTVRRGRSGAGRRGETGPCFGRRRRHAPGREGRGRTGGVDLRVVAERQHQRRRERVAHHVEEPERPRPAPPRVVVVGVAAPGARVGVARPGASCGSLRSSLRPPPGPADATRRPPMSLRHAACNSRLPCPPPWTPPPVLRVPARPPARWLRHASARSSSGYTGRASPPRGPARRLTRRAATPARRRYSPSRRRVSRGPRYDPDVSPIWRCWARNSKGALRRFSCGGGVRTGEDQVRYTGRMAGSYSLRPPKTLLLCYSFFNNGLLSRLS